MTEFAKSRFWKSVSVALVVSLILIGIGLVTDRRVEIIRSAEAVQQTGTAIVPLGWFVAFSEKGDIMYLYNLERSTGKPYLEESFMFRVGSGVER